MSIWTSILLVLCVGVLGFQILLLRQIGILHHRLGPPVDSSGSAPGTPQAAPLVLPADFRVETPEGSRPLVGGGETYLVFLSLQCYLCKPLLEQAATLTRTPGLRIGLVGVERDNLAEACRAHGIPAEHCCRGDEVRSLAPQSSVPGLLRIAPTGRVVDHGYVDSQKTILEIIEKTT